LKSNGEFPIDDAIANAKRELEKQDHDLENPHKETFKSTHPLWAARIHLNAARHYITLYFSPKNRYIFENEYIYLHL
jgi:hypothetical protein